MDASVFFARPVKRGGHVTAAVIEHRTRVVIGARAAKGLSISRYRTRIGVYRIIIIIIVRAYHFTEALPRRPRVVPRLR